MFCTKCGATIQEGNRYCVACGAPVQASPAGPDQKEAAPAPAVQTPPPQPQTPPPAAMPVPPLPARRRRLGGGAIALIVTAVALTVAAVVLLILFLNPWRDSAASGEGQTGLPSPAPAEEALGQAASGTEEGVLSAPILMDGVYYCAQEPGSTLELRREGEDLSIYKTYYTSVDVSTLIPAPSGADFTIDYGGRLIRFAYSVADQSVTVTEGEYVSRFTPDGDRGWVMESARDVQDPFSDPDGYILPSDSRYLTDQDLEGMDLSQLQLARNEIFARHGYSFSDPKYQTYFRGKSWYYENPTVNDTTYQNLNAYEQENIRLIQAREAELKG